MFGDPPLKLRVGEKIYPLIGDGEPLTVVKVFPEFNGWIIAALDDGSYLGHPKVARKRAQ